jgi:hypothetical protein
MGLIVLVFVLFELIGCFMVIGGLVSQDWIRRITYVIAGLLLIGLDSWWFYLTITMLKR